MPVQSMQNIAEHTMFKAALPIVCAVLIGSISWIFVSIQEIDKSLHRIEESEIPRINAELAKSARLLEKLEEQITNMRINHAKMVQQLESRIKETGTKNTFRDITTDKVEMK